MSGYKINFNQDFSAPDRSEFGLIGSNAGYSDDDNIDLKVELSALQSGQSELPVKKPKRQPIKQSELDRMVAESLKDINEDDDILDEDDPNLLNELQELTGGTVKEKSEGSENEENVNIPQKNESTTTSSSLVGLLNQRIETYKLAEQNAEAANESTRARRFNRGLKTLQDILKQAKAGKTINNEDIPLEITIKTPSLQTEEKTGSIKSVSSNPKLISISNNTSSQIETPICEQEIPLNLKLIQLRSRQQEYKVAALEAKHNENIENAKQFLQIINQFDTVIKMAEDSQSVDLSDMPPPPDQLKKFLAKLEAGEQTN